MPNEFPQPQPGPELITHVPSAEELAVHDAQRSHIEDTLTLGAYKAAQAGATEHAADLNQQHPVKSNYMRQPLTYEALREPSEVPEHDQTVTREELNAALQQLRDEGKIE